MRRSDNLFYFIKKLLLKEKSYIKFTIYYSKGVLNTCSHFIDLIYFITANLDDITIKIKDKTPYSINDFECLFIIKNKFFEAKFIPLGMNSSNFNLFFINTSRFSIKFDNKNEQVCLYDKIQNKFMNLKQNINFIQNNFTDDIYNVINFNKNLDKLCSINEAIKTHTIIEKLRSYSEKNY